MNWIKNTQRVYFQPINITHDGMKGRHLAYDTFEEAKEWLDERNLKLRFPDQKQWIEVVFESKIILEIE